MRINTRFNKIYIFLLWGVFFSFLSSILNAQEQQIILGGKLPWRILEEKNITQTEGRRGYPSLVLKAFEPRGLSEKNKDLALTFQTPDKAIVQGNYELDIPYPLFVSNEFSRRQTGSLLFVEKKNPLVLKVLEKSLFSIGNISDRFTIEFWLYPNKNSDSEVILSWKGLMKSGESLKTQKVQASLEGGALKWIFENTFFGDNLEDTLFEVKGISPLKPKTWSHHLLRYDSTSGLLEYFVDGKPSAITKVYNEKEDTKNSYSFYVGTLGDNKLILGEDFTGSLDDIFISKEWETFSALSNNVYTKQEAYFITEALDLQTSQAQLLSVNTLQETPQSTYIEYQYRISDELSFDPDKTGKVVKNVKGEWKPIVVNTPVEQLGRGRYLQIKASLLPEGTGQYTPSLSQVRIQYLPNAPSNAPSILEVKAGQGQISLEWAPSLSSQVKGYMLYFGTQPKFYYGDGKITSPIDLGNRTSYTLNGLKNGQIYYLSLVAYGEGDPPTLSNFSEEVSARPLESLPQEIEN